MGAGMPDPMVLVPIPLDPMLFEPMLFEPIGALLLDVEPDELMPLPYPDEELDEPVDGVIVGAGAGMMPVSSTFLLQAPSANNAASANDVTATVLIFRSDIRISFGK